MRNLRSLATSSFDFRRGTFARRRFSARSEPDALVLEIGAPEGSYRPRPRPVIVKLRSDARRVSVRSGTAAAVPLPRTDDLEKAERGWTLRDGVVLARMPDHFERLEFRFER